MTCPAPGIDEQVKWHETQGRYGTACCHCHTEKEETSITRESFMEAKPHQIRTGRNLTVFSLVGLRGVVIREVNSPLKSFMATPREATCHVTTAHAHRPSSSRIRHVSMCF